MLVEGDASFYPHHHQRHRALSSYHASGRQSICVSVHLPMHLSVHAEQLYHYNSLRISAIGLKFGGMKHITMKQIYM